MNTFKKLFFMITVATVVGTTHVNADNSKKDSENHQETDGNTPQPSKDPLGNEKQPGAIFKALFDRMKENQGSEDIQGPGGNIRIVSIQDLEREEYFRNLERMRNNPPNKEEKNERASLFLKLFETQKNNYSDETDALNNDSKDNNNNPQPSKDLLGNEKEPGAIFKAIENNLNQRTTNTTPQGNNNNIRMQSVIKKINDLLKKIKDDNETDEGQPPTNNTPKDNNNTETQGNFTKGFDDMLQKIMEKTQGANPAREGERPINNTTGLILEAMKTKKGTEGAINFQTCLLEKVFFIWLIITFFSITKQ